MVFQTFVHYLCDRFYDAWTYYGHITFTVNVGASAAQFEEGANTCLLYLIK